MLRSMRSQTHAAKVSRNIPINRVCIGSLLYNRRTDYKITAFLVHDEISVKRLRYFMKKADFYLLYLHSKTKALVGIRPTATENPNDLKGKLFVADSR